MESEDRRSAPRMEINVEMEIRKNGDVFSGTSVNVSETGILIQTNKVLFPGQIVTVRVTSPGREDIVGTGTVIRNEDLGLGKHALAVQWDLTAPQKVALRRMVAPRP
jgi:PilZ domain-containing protein